LIAIGSAAVFLTAIVLTLRVWRPAPAARTDTLSHGRLTKITSTPGLNVDPALSPDGSMLAYASDRAGRGNFDIWLQPVAGGTAIQITSDPADETEPSFSPDGSSIVFARRETGGIFIVGVLGGEPRLVAPGTRARTPRFSPDGRSIAYWTGLPVSISRAAGASGASFIVPATGGPPRAIAPEFASARHPVWSPDGQRLLFLGGESPTDPRLDWYVVQADGSKPVKTGAFDALREAGAASIRDVPIPSGWTRDYVVLTSTTARTSSNVWQLSISQAGQVTGPPHRLTFGTAVERSPADAGHGAVAFASLMENVDVWRVPLDSKTGLAGGSLERVTDNPAVDAVGNVSRDGKLLAFVSSRTQSNEVWFRDLESGRERQFAYSSAFDLQLSPDRSKIALWRGEAEKREVVVVDSSDGKTSTLCIECDRSFGWAPDGSRVLFARNQPSRLYVRDVAAGREVLLADHPSWLLRQARFSPDGRWVAFFAAVSPDKRQVYIIPGAATDRIPSSAWVHVADDSGFQPSWSDDGSKIYYLSERDGAICVWVQPLDATKHPIGEPLAVQHFHEPHLRAGTTAIATNDVRAGYLYVTLTETTGNIWMLK
jgi:Tol biopolymer transport system component